MFINPGSWAFMITGSNRTPLKISCGCWMTCANVGWTNGSIASPRPRTQAEDLPRDGALEVGPLGAWVNHPIHRLPAARVPFSIFRTLLLDLKAPRLTESCRQQRTP